MKKLISLLLVLTVLSALPVLAMGATPSPERPAVLAPIPFFVFEGDPIGAIGRDANGKVIGYIATNDIVVTPATSVDDAVKEAIEGSDALPAGSHKVSDLFTLAFVGTGAKTANAIFAAGGYVEITLPITVVKDATVNIATQGNDGWTFVDAENIINNGDGTYTIRVAEAGAIAVVQTVADSTQDALVAQVISWIRDNFASLLDMFNKAK